MSVLQEAKNLISNARDQAEKKRAAAQREYAQILARQDAGTKDDAGRLIKLAEELGLSMDDVSQHAEAVASVERHKKSIVSDAEQERLHQALVNAVAEHEEAEKKWKKLDEELRAKRFEASLARQQGTTISEAAREAVNRLQKENPVAFVTNA
jgi:hypothetical protein